MNTKKNKSKSRGKTTKTTQDAVSSVVDEKIDSKLAESLNNNENRVPETITECDIVPDSEQTISDVPKKPKRSKLKKRNDALTEDIRNWQHDEITQNITEEVAQITPCVRKKKKKAKKQDINSKELFELNVMECVEKGCDKISEIDKLENINQIETENTEMTPKDQSETKKKKKKKHSRDPCTLDFQKLLEADEAPSKTENIEEQQTQLSGDNILSNVNSSEAICINENPIQEVCANFETKKLINKKKYKKDKTLLPKAEGLVQKEAEKCSTDQSIVSEESNKDFIISPESMTNESEIKESSPKPKAKIAKPVIKKSKIHINKQKDKDSESKDISSYMSDNIINDNTSDVDQNIGNKYLKVVGQNKIVEKEFQKDNDFGKEVEFTLAGEKSEMLNIENDCTYENRSNQCCSINQEIKTSEILNDFILDRNQEKVTQEQTHDKQILGFVEVETNKKNIAKQSVNPLFISGATDTLEIKPMVEIQQGDHILNLDINFQKDDTKKIQDTCLTSTEESDVKMEDTFQLSIPDRIEYPRSTSQYFIENNNNDTLIQEIISPEAKLGIPISVVTPIIQGSGESPDVNYVSAPMDINVTEILTRSEKIVGQTKDSVTTSPCAKDLLHEKTDIKSKMIEVNQDMEELRLSIERSLAEFSFIEKSEDGVDEKCETLLIQNVNPLPVKVNTEKIVNPEYKCKVNEVHCNIEECDQTVGDEDNKNILKEKVIEDVLIPDDNHQKNVTENIIPVCPVRRDKGKNKAKNKSKKETVGTTPSNGRKIISATSTVQSDTQEPTKNCKSEKSEKKSESSQENTKQHTLDNKGESTTVQNLEISFIPIENFEDALSSSVDDVNKTFDIIVEDANQSNDLIQCHTNPQINIISPVEEMDPEGDTQKNNDKTKNQTLVSPPKNLLGRPNIPASSNKIDYKKEKNKIPNLLQAKVKIKDLVDFEKSSKETKNNGKKLIKDTNELNSIYFTYVHGNLIYKYSFRKVFLQNMCHVCKKYLNQRVPCIFCALVFYCSQKHKDEDWSQHQSLCFAVSTITHVKGLKHIYADTKDITGNDYRVLRQQVILSCEKILNRKLMPWEQEALLYPRLCNDDKCRQWKQGQLKDCEGCGQVSYCIDNPHHLQSSHQRWCKSFALYQKLVSYQLATGRLEPPLPTKVLRHYQMPEKMNDVLGSMYENKIDIDDIQYAALTELATAPMTTAYCHQVFSSKMNPVSANGVGTKSSYTIHAIGVKLPFEVDSLNKWELFFLHMRSDVQTLKVVMFGQDLKSSKLPLDILKNIKLCKDCQANKRQVLFDFRDNERYYNYYLSDDYAKPDIVCAFNAHIQRSSIFNTEIWPSAINCILKQRVPFVITAYTIEELRRDLDKVKEWADVDFNVVSEIKYNPFCSVRPDRNFITDHEMPLLLKNYCFCITCGAL